MASHKWQFTTRFRRHAYGWNASNTAIQRIKEAVSEIKQIARKEPLLAAEGAVTFIEKLTPAIEQVDSSSGSLGSAVRKAIDTLVPVIAKLDAEAVQRQQWLERLWQAMLDDEISYIEVLGDYWGELCVSSELASQWADRFMPLLEQNWRSRGDGYFQGTSVCLASLFKASRHEELLNLLAKDPYPSWHTRQWGIRALVGLGRKAEAIQYAENVQSLNQPGSLIAQACEEILLSSGMHEEAYRRYAREANQSATHLATFKAIVKKYPAIAPETILRDLIASTPGSEGKWFAAAKEAGLFELAAELVRNSPTDPRTLMRAARGFVDTKPDFAMACGLAALHWMAQGYGYELTASDLLDTYKLAVQAAVNTSTPLPALHEQIEQKLTGKTAGVKWIRELLDRHRVRN